MRIAMAFLVVSTAVASAGRAQEVRSAGATDWFGRGILGVRQSGTEVRLELRTESQGMLLRLVEGEPITIVAVGPFAAGESIVRLPAAAPPERVEASADRPGVLSNTGVRNTDIMRTSSCLKSQGEGPGAAPIPPGTPTVNGQPTVDPGICVSTTRRPPITASVLRAPAREYLLLVLSDRAPDSIVTGRIGTIPGFDPATAAHDLAEYLVGRQSPMWAGYLARR
jgi:hypothetical protein